MTVPPLARSARLTLSAAGIHRDEHVRLVSRRQDVVVGEVNLEAGDARKRAGGRADLGGKVRQRGEVVSEDGGLAREAVPGQLHAVSGVAGEADHDPLELLDRFRLGYESGIADNAAPRATMKISEHIHIDRPPEEVWAVVVRSERHTPRGDLHWSSFARCRKARSSVGSRIHEKIRWRGREIEIDDVVTALDPPRRLGIRGGWKPADFELDFLLHSRGWRHARDLRLVVPPQDVADADGHADPRPDAAELHEGRARRPEEVRRDRTALSSASARSA